MRSLGKMSTPGSDNFWKGVQSAQRVRLPTVLYKLVVIRTCEIEGDPYEEMSKKVSSLLREGWSCKGGISIVNDPGDGARLVQAMISKRAIIAAFDDFCRYSS
jgi:hypothetical protein